MNRRTFIAGLSVTTATLLAGCSGGDEADTTTETDGTGTTGGTTTDGTGNGTTTTTETTEEGTTETGTTESGTETDTSETTTAEAQAVAFGESAELSNGLRVAVTDASTQGSYDGDDGTASASEGNVFLLTTFETTNGGSGSRSLPDDSKAAVLAQSERYQLHAGSETRWQEYASASVGSGDTSTVSVAFEVPEKAVSSLGLQVELSYSGSDGRRAVRWAME